MRRLEYFHHPAALAKRTETLKPFREETAAKEPYSGSQSEDRCLGTGALRLKCRPVAEGDLSPEIVGFTHFLNDLPSGKLT